jgi:FkbM family methyltransferase
MLNETNWLENNSKKEFFSKLAKILRSQMVIVDVGASYGTYTFQVNKALSSGSIYTIEPDPIKFGKLKEKCPQWEKDSDNKIHLLQIGISDRDGQSNFFFSNSPTHGSILKEDISQVKQELEDVTAWEEITVDIYQLDTLFKPIKPDIIKIDVTGRELPILQGSVGILKTGKAKFLIQFSHQDSSEIAASKDKIYEFMKSFDYYPSNFYGMILFRNPKQDKKSRFDTFKLVTRRIISPSLRYWIREFIKK